MSRMQLTMKGTRSKLSSKKSRAKILVTKEFGTACFRRLVSEQRQKEEMQVEASACDLVAFVLTVHKKRCKHSVGMRGSTLRNVEDAAMSSTNRF